MSADRRDAEHQEMDQLAAPPPNATKQRTIPGLMAGIGASGAVLAGAIVAFVVLVGAVSFDAWPNSGADPTAETGELFSGGGEGGEAISTSAITTTAADVARPFADDTGSAGARGEGRRGDGNGGNGGRSDEAPSVSDGPSTPSTGSSQSGGSAGSGGGNGGVADDDDNPAPRPTPSGQRDNGGSNHGSSTGSSTGTSTSGGTSGGEAQRESDRPSQGGQR
jgi:hypothetical protein